MKSVQAPRKITVKGSDGKDYFFLCKPNDDLRKDARVMEINSMLNHLLAKDPEARKRRLCIRTYAAVPLSKDCGLVEWVGNTKVYRAILEAIYQAKGIRLPVSAVFAGMALLDSFVANTPNNRTKLSCCKHSKGGLRQPQPQSQHQSQRQIQTQIWTQLSRRL